MTLEVRKPPYDCATRVERRQLTASGGEKLFRKSEIGGTHPAPDADALLVNVRPLRPLARRGDDVLRLDLAEALAHRRAELAAAEARAARVDPHDDVAERDGEVVVPVALEPGRDRLRVGPAVPVREVRNISSSFLVVQEGEGARAGRTPGTRPGSASCRSSPSAAGAAPSRRARRRPYRRRGRRTCREA